MDTTFQTELQFFKDNQDRLVQQCDGKTLVLRGKQVVGTYDSKLEAYLDAKKRFGAGNFMIQECRPGPDAYTATVVSLGVIADA
jgi:hypothetical protein